MSSKSEREAAWRDVSEYHEACLLQLIQRAGVAVDQARSGELDPFEADQELFQYSRAAKELWKFCNTTDVEFVAQLVRDRESNPIDWWERGTFRRN